MACYVIGAPLLLWLALYLVRQRSYGWSIFFGSLSLLFVWYVVEITIAATGVNTREYRIVGTPMVLAATIALVWNVWSLRKWRNAWFLKRGEHNRV